MSKAAATITDRIMSPMLRWTAVKVLCLIQVVKPLLLPVGCLSWLPFEAPKRLVVVQGNPRKTMYFVCA